ncbi:hypothetical protein [Bacillus suaedae]|uniref:Uncharacterized protein n=1 Tax=Halalkalibacter suaedae TaxID=2822140 RepID=A0A941AQM4_9BACI|nr:hypothetical protein [Bacillus suaedae]MBP3952961.1 hypothetical protein [Bacillus suaedae]
MITLDQKNNQILSSLCRNCKDPYFQPPTHLKKVGCCSYSPTFQLLELSKMCTLDQAQFNLIYNHPDAIIHPYSITVKAAIDPSHDEVKHSSSLTQLERDDLELSYSVCQFFEDRKGCSLQPSFKNAVCRSFICSTIEDSLPNRDKASVQSWTKNIHTQSKEFQHTHEQALLHLGIDLISSPKKVIHYFQALAKE